MIDPRAVLADLIRDRGDDYASLSRLLGRNAAYVQQYIRRGVPRKLDEDDRRTLARYFRIDEAMLGGPPSLITDRGKSRTRQSGKLVLVPQLAVGASAGPGALEGDEAAFTQIGFDAGWLRGMTANPSAVSAIRVTGDSMMPTLGNGDDILVDASDAAERLRDGIYVLRFDDALNVKRIAIYPTSSRYTIHSDNAAYPDWPDCDPERIAIIGRVIWTGRRVI